MIKPTRILLAEHDKDLASITKNFLVSRGYPTVTCSDGEEALQHFRRSDSTLFCSMSTCLL